MRDTKDYLITRPAEKRLQIHLKLSKKNMDEVTRLSKKHKLSNSFWLNFWDLAEYDGITGKKKLDVLLKELMDYHIE